MDGKALGGIIAGVVSFIVISTLITNVITGTSTGDVLLQTILTIETIAILWSLIVILGNKIGLIRGNLNLKRYDNPELNRDYKSLKCVETIDPISCIPSIIVY